MGVLSRDIESNPWVKAHITQAHRHSVFERFEQLLSRVVNVFVVCGSKQSFLFSARAFCKSTLQLRPRLWQQKQSQR
jgi:hypothetical protein